MQTELQRIKESQGNSITMIAAMAANRVIGRNNSIPWHVRTDFKHFKDATKGHHMIMGRKTYESIGRPLPGRTTIIVTSNHDYKMEGCIVTHSPEEALRVCKDVKQVFIAGGSQIYEIFMPVADVLDLTTIDAKIDGDTVFPRIDFQKFSMTKDDKGLKTINDDYDFSFQMYVSKTKIK